MNNSTDYTHKTFLIKKGNLQYQKVINLPEISGVNKLSLTN